VVYYGFMPGGSSAFEIHRKPLSGTGQDERVIESGINGVPTSLSHDGQFLLFNQTGSKTDSDIWALPLTGERKPVPYLQTPFAEGDAVFAPVAGATRWVAYASSESGRTQVYLQQFPASGVKYQVSTSGGEGPAWRADGRELFYIENATVYAVPISLGSSVDIGTPTALDRNPNVSSAAVAADGQRFLVALPAGGTDAAPPITAVLNWAAGLE
jgi:Tol biopolymer transport system component